MKNKLKYIIEESVKRGWDMFHEDNCFKRVDGMRIILESKTSGVIMGEPSISDIFFSHDWAKCVFGEEFVCSVCTTELQEKYEHEIYEPGIRECKYSGELVDDKKSYLYHLSQLSQLETDEERVDYVYAYLTEQNNIDALTF